MHEPQVTETVTGDIVPAGVPSLAGTALAAYRAGASEARRLTVVYAPVTVAHHHAAPALVPAASDAPARVLPGVPEPVAVAVAGPGRRRFTLPELCFYLGMAVTGSSTLAVALSIVAGDPTLLLGAPAALGTVAILGSAAAINRQEGAR